jgi:hypothetical protein
MPFNYFSYYKETRKITMDELRMRTKLQQFLNEMPRSLLKISSQRQGYYKGYIQ